MTFKSSVAQDLAALLHQFPRTFTVEELANYFEWKASRARAAIAYGLNEDAIRTLKEHRQQKGQTSTAVYENVKWRQEWLKRAWGTSDVRDMDSQEQRHS